MGSEMVWSHFDGYSVNKLSQVALRCCMDVENKCAMSHCTLCLGQVRKCVVDIQVLISPPHFGVGHAVVCEGTF